ncbi:Lrp/AsnC family transcriptional regulator [Paremcibacter congregatus]|uniref:AsnC family transcriptional regulator n=1 Tax=Paremcibacter congregatus TaxID=2043170 RepID=A0A2G4YMS8_9PROT|nr:Lrp/AsnC family transcriptional regulator [Paremcibacter congregatus]PHZ83621.1 AsnC family transcriptional regulator [Paremcibacter congregatus]QDE27321.1 Lrp/AsnC family transcriptional regulator [Paremcibacter congregatus]|tara:strand:- start:590 stop:1039 length:450 start_codon:yes stop_codon:yes gene_type:complete
MDALDIKILNLLQDDALMTVVEIADKIGSSKSVCWRRIQRLQDDGVIKKRVALLEHNKVGLDIILFAHVKMTAHGRKLPKFIEVIKDIPQIVECYTLMGNVDFLLKIVVEDIQQYEELWWNHLSPIEGVQEINSTIAMTEVKHTTRLPL